MISEGMYFDLLNDLAREFPSETSTDAKLISFFKILLLTVFAEISSDLIMGTLLDLRMDRELVNLDKFESIINLLMILKLILIKRMKIVFQKYYKKKIHKKKKFWHWKMK